MARNQSLNSLAGWAYNVIHWPDIDGWGRLLPPADGSEVVGSPVSDLEQIPHTTPVVLLVFLFAPGRLIVRGQGAVCTRCERLQMVR